MLRSLIIPYLERALSHYKHSIMLRKQLKKMILERVLPEFGPKRAKISRKVRDSDNNRTEL